MRAAPTFPASPLTVVPWPDDLIDLMGHDVCGDYVEHYWLGVLGPTSTWILRRLVADLERRPAGFVLDLAEVAGAVGIGLHGGKNSTFMRSLGRLVIFDAAQLQPGGVLAVRRKLPQLGTRHLNRLPPGLRARHETWQRQQLHQSA